MGKPQDSPADTPRRLTVEELLSGKKPKVAKPPPPAKEKRGKKEPPPKGTKDFGYLTTEEKDKLRQIVQKAQDYSNEVEKLYKSMDPQRLDQFFSKNGGMVVAVLTGLSPKVCQALGFSEDEQTRVSTGIFLGRSDSMEDMPPLLTPNFKEGLYTALIQLMIASLHKVMGPFGMAPALDISLFTANELAMYRELQTELANEVIATVKRGEKPDIQKIVEKLRSVTLVRVKGHDDEEEDPE
ncbi:MAG: hypothetical protein GYA36_19055 [Veillonellaceae bacterium]|nr:hypothetical protein [Veillonellaceae bacterium]